MIATIITYILIVSAAISALAIVFVREVFHAAILLLVCLLCVAGIFVTFNAEFLAVVQILVYAGGALLLIVFGIILTARNNDTITWNTSQSEIISGIIGFTLFAIMVYALEGTGVTPGVYEQLSPQTIGFAMMTSYSLPFELSGILLLVSLIAAIVAATSGKSNQDVR